MSWVSDVRRAYAHSDTNINSEGVGMSGKSILTAAVVALVVVIGYDQYKQRRA